MLICDSKDYSLNSDRSKYIRTESLAFQYTLNLPFHSGIRTHASFPFLSGINNNNNNLFYIAYNPPKGALKCRDQIVNRNMHTRMVDSDSGIARGCHNVTHQRMVSVWSRD